MSTIPDAADVFAFKSAIDNLARPVAVLEKRLAVNPTSLPPQPVPGHKTIEPSSVTPSVSPDHRI
jgi:hypothetical protein